MHFMPVYVCSKQIDVRKAAWPSCNTPREVDSCRMELLLICCAVSVNAGSFQADIDPANVPCGQHSSVSLCVDGSAELCLLACVGLCLSAMYYKLCSK